MKILTLTTYQGYNYGASLQAYALQHYLQSRGHDAQIIRYEPEYLMCYYAFWYVNPESSLSRNSLTRMVYRFAKLGQRLTTLRRKRVFDYFNHHILRETPQRFLSSDSLMQHPPQADLYLCGSDQIWNVLYEAGQDPIFYLDFVRQGLKASYAASFSYLDIPHNHLTRIAQSLGKFDAVSVRERHGLDILQRMGVNGTWVLDPVFLLNIDEWEHLLNLPTPQYESIPQEEDYLLIYDFEGNADLKDFALHYAQKYGLKIYAIVDRFPLHYADRNFRSAGPIDFVRLIKGSKAFISNSFHGTAFSLIFHRPFFVFNRNRHKVNSRMESLLSLFNLQDCLIDSSEKKKEALMRTFDWDDVERRKQTALQTSVDFLSRLGV